MIRLSDAIRAHACATPDAIAIDSGRHGRVDWRALPGMIALARDGLVGQLADRTRPVAVMLDQGIDACIAELVLERAQIPILDLPGFFTPTQRAHALTASGAQALIASGAQSLAAGEGWPGFTVEALEHPAAALPEGTGRISFTSGSTGDAKGICLSAGHLIGVARAVINHVGIGHAGRHLALLPRGILLETVAGFSATLLAGGTYVALPQAEVGLAQPFRPDFAMMAAVIAEQRITSLILVPEYLAGLVAILEATGARLPLLTLVAVGGARLSRDLIDRAIAVGLPVRQGYGLTECGSVITLECASEAVRGSVGTGIGANAISLAADGEIVVGGPVCLGTIGAPHPAGPYHTGDIGRIDADGRLWIEGRKANRIITSHGRNIAPEWVETALIAQPGIAQALVHGEAEATLSALIVAADPQRIAAAVATANAGLPAYAQVAHWRAVPPFTPSNGQLTANGRLRRAAIVAFHLKGPTSMRFFDRLVAETRAARDALAAVPQLQAGLAGHIDRTTYIAYLTQAYHHVRHTVPLMQAARARLNARPLLAAALDDYIFEETGHENWILSDIFAAGGDGQAAAYSEPHAATAAMIDHAYDAVLDGNPAALFGMIYVLESTSVAMATGGAEAVRRTLGLPAEAFTYLTSHGALDLDHMHFFTELMGRVDDPGDQQAIIAMANAMFGLFAGLFAAIPMERLDAAA